MNRNELASAGMIGLHMTNPLVGSEEWDNAWPVVNATGHIVAIFDSDDIESERHLVGVLWIQGRLVLSDESCADAFAYPASIQRSQRDRSIREIPAINVELEEVKR
jgi:hypothetical protein